MPEYILDADIFIDSHQRHYCIGFCPAFWDWLILKNKAGIVFSEEHVCKELKRDDDVLSLWADELGSEFFLPFDQPATDCIGKIAVWVANQRRFTTQAIDKFYNGADMYLIAYALAHGHTVVTHEQPAPNSKNSIKIPDVCNGVGVNTIYLWDLLRLERAKFVLQIENYIDTGG